MGLFMMGFMAEGMTAIREELADLRQKTDRLVTGRESRTEPED